MRERRKFIKTLGRGVLFAGLVGLGGTLILKERPEDADPCDFDFICKNCKKRKSCDLPEAKLNRKAKNRNS